MNSMFESVEQRHIPRLVYVLEREMANGGDSIRTHLGVFESLINAKNAAEALVTEDDRARAVKDGSECYNKWVDDDLSLLRAWQFRTSTWGYTVFSIVEIPLNTLLKSSLTLDEME
jgi:hypothetical protein